MSVNVVEGKFIRMSNNYDEIKEIAKNLTGYLRISVKRNNGFEEGYIFLEKGKRVGYYYNYGLDEKFGKNAKEKIDNMKNDDYVVEIYEYDDTKLKLMRDLFREMFIEKSSKVEKKVELKEESKKHIGGNYKKIVLDIPEGKPIKLGANENWERYLKGKVLLDIFKKHKDGYMRCYVIYENNTPIMAAYEDNNGVLFGKEAYSIIKDILNDSNAIIDVYEYDDSKIDILNEYYPEMSLIEKTSENDEMDEEEDLDEFVESLINKQKKIDEEENLSKEELLKKLGIKLPDDELIDNFVSSVIAPDEDELKNLEEEFKEKIERFLKGEENIQSYTINLSVEYDDGYICKCNIELIPKKKLGIIKKDINTEYIIDKINRIIKDNILDVKPELTVNVK